MRYVSYKLDIQQGIALYADFPQIYKTILGMFAEGLGRSRYEDIHDACKPSESGLTYMYK